MLCTVAMAPDAHGATRSDLLRGAYGPYRANNDLLFYHLDIRVDPERKFIQGKNTIRFRMLKDGRRIQLDLHPALHVDKISLGQSAVALSARTGRCVCRLPADAQGRPRIQH